MLLWFVPNDSKSKHALIDDITYRLVAYIDLANSYIFTDVQLNDEASMILDKIYEYSDKDFKIAGNMIKFMLDNDAALNESKFKLTGYLYIDIDDFNADKKNKIQYNGLRSAKQVYNSKKVAFSSIEWHISNKPYMKPVK